ncbi:MAG TPA: serine hydrolase domain-containing protein [Bryobacteraceae bacterium]|jgi:CubicO group peptidase (beta-lactamase class C family)|nr:serine hydrolase domain-containing protein [Bryobacteraceae bacterium]
MRISIGLVALMAFPAFCGGATDATVPRFTDPARRAKLEAEFPRIEKVFERFQQEHRIPGAAFGIVIDSELAYFKGFGVRDRTSQDPVTPDTVFRIASMTKSFTALSILKLRDAGKLSLEDPVAKWIPEFARFQYPTRDTAPIRIRQLMSHGAGFPEDNPWGDRQLSTDDATLTRWLELGLPFSTPPDTSYEYSNYGFALLGRIVSKASGVPYAEYLTKNILAPLGMRSTTLEAATLPANVRATGYRLLENEYFEEPSLPHGAFGSMGGLLTSARDLGRYVAFHLSAFPPRDDEDRGPVERSSIREMQHPWREHTLTATRSSPDAPLRVRSVAYGYGLGISRDCHFSHIVGHGGGLPGFGSYMMWLPDYGVGMFAMTNLTYAGPAAALAEAFEILEATGALKPRELPPSPALVSTRDAILRLWRNWDDREADAIAANNLFLDTPADVRRRGIEKVKTEMGECKPAGDIQPENLLRGKFRLLCERGFVDVAFTLAPTMPPKLQYLSFATTKSLDANMKAVAESLASLIGSPSDGRLAALAAPSLDAVAVRRAVEAARLSYGSCRVGETLGGDGKSHARVRLECDRAPLELAFGTDEQGKVRRASFLSATGVACVP